MLRRVSTVLLRKVHTVEVKRTRILLKDDLSLSTHVGPFVRSVKGHSYLLMVVDGFTKYVLAKPIKSSRSTEAVANLCTQGFNQV